jgi:glycosyltransferase involved in cell wall biosynthesis
VIFSFHDYYMICPSVKLLDENLRPCNGVCTPTPGPCVSELWNDARMPQLKHGYVHPWKARARQVLSPCDAFVTTAASAAEIIGRNFPDFAGRLEVIPHGRSFPSFGRAAAMPVSADQPFRILIAGGLSKAKGSALVSAAARELRREGIEFHLLGNADDGLDRNLVTCHGAYERADFMARAAEIGPAIGILPSLWPETYCHVLTEMWASGLAVLAYDIGAVGERIRAKGGGWLFDEASAELLCDAIRFLRAHPEEIEGRLNEVYDWQAGEGSQLTDVAMAKAYADLYSRVLRRRQVLAAHAPMLREVAGVR